MLGLLNRQQEQCPFASDNYFGLDDRPSTRTLPCKLSCSSSCSCQHLLRCCCNFPPLR
jgi:hypothetical protein